LVAEWYSRPQSFPHQPPDVHPIAYTEAGRFPTELIRCIPAQFPAQYVRLAGLGTERGGLGYQAQYMLLWHPPDATLHRRNITRDFLILFLQRHPMDSDPRYVQTATAGPAIVLGIYLVYLLLAPKAGFWAQVPWSGRRREWFASVRTSLRAIKGLGAMAEDGYRQVGIEDNPPWETSSKP
jgi:hypothetical protein